MKPRISMITLGVKDLARSIQFYQDGLLLPQYPFDSETVAFFNLNGTWLGLFGEEALAEDAGVNNQSAPYNRCTLAHNLESKEAVDAQMAEAKAAGATITKAAHDTFWGGYSGYFADPDGHLWEIAHNPFEWIGPED